MGEQRRFSVHGWTDSHPQKLVKVRWLPSTVAVEDLGQIGQDLIDLADEATDRQLSAVEVAYMVEAVFAVLFLEPPR